jgi:hypothetical protein
MNTGVAFWQGGGVFADTSSLFTAVQSSFSRNRHLQVGAQEKAMCAMAATFIHSEHQASPSGVLSYVASLVLDAREPD